MEPNQSTTNSSCASAKALSAGVAEFTGYPLPTRNAIYTPNQFFDVVLPHSSRGMTRLVAYMLRRVLGWSNRDGSAREPQVCVSYAELIENAGISHGSIREAIDEALRARYVRCVRTGQRKTRNQPGASSLFELSWDDRPQYVTNPDEFQGFFFGIGNRTNIPNTFFDYTVRQESLSVVQVVGAIMRHSIGFQTRPGQRRQEVSLSFEDLLRITRIKSRSTLNLALKEARQNRHIVCLSSGYFGNGALQAKAKYSICWNSQIEPPKVQEEVPPKEMEDESGQKSNQESIKEFGCKRPEIEPRSVQKSNHHLAKNQTSLEITDLNNKNKQQQQRPSAAVCVESFAILSEVGFDSRAAEQLAATHPKELIQNQVAWLPKRNPVKNRLGFLRRAIEGNWAAPEGGLASTNAKAAEVFAKHYYAGYHGTLEPASDPFPQDSSASQNFLRKLGIETNLEAAATSGRAFGRLVRSKHQADPKSKPFLTTALVLFGNEFARSYQQRSEGQKRETIRSHQEAHRKANWPNYMAYLREAEKSMQQSNREAYESFHKEWLQSLDSMKQFNVDPVGFSVDDARVLAFAELFAKRPQYQVLDFWQWDRRTNRDCLQASNG